MKVLQLSGLTIVAALAASLSIADEGKDESGKGGQPRHQPYHQPSQRGDSYFHEHGYTRLNIPEGHYPPLGECRIWYPERPAGQQPPPIKCGAKVPDGAWLIHHPQDTPDYVLVTVYEPRHPGVIRVVGEFDIGSGVLIRAVLDK